MSATDRPDALGARIRPYAITGGRTRARTDLPVEAMVRTSGSGLADRPRLTLERHAIVELCVTPHSVAEVSALLHLHLGVARVLIGDLADEGLLAVHRPDLVGDRPDLRLLERVLDGLQAL
ncbi:MAG TPA: DUF742 domain-containing protein [Acidimicrobiales bacterium]|nr:DUF742 domain-containing protein [Acidimicrobiales bacterium]